MATAQCTPISQAGFLYESLVTGRTGFGSRPLVVFTLPTVGKTHLVKNLNAVYGRDNGIAIDLDYKAPKHLLAHDDGVRKVHSYLINNFIASDQIKLIATFVDWVDLDELNTRTSAVLFVIPDITAEEAAAREVARAGGVRTAFADETLREWNVWRMRLETVAASGYIPAKVIRTKRHLSDELASMFADYQANLVQNEVDRICPETPFTETILKEIRRYVYGNIETHRVG